MTGSQSDLFDVIIVGAGPAGSTCAFECARRGLRALLLDRDAFPRRKPCGGAVAERALAYLDFSLPEEIVERECYSAVVRFNGRRVHIRKDARIAVLVSRDRFDAFLADKAVEAGARFLQGVHVTDVVPHEDSVEVRTDRGSYRSSFLVGADGVHSIVARSVRPPLPKDEMALALVCSVPAENVGDGAEERDGALDMLFGIAPLGYGWDFPHAGYRSIGVMGRASDFREPAQALSEYANSLGVDAKGVRGHFIPYGGIKRKIVEGRILLVGDAAGYGDAFTGEGIVHAVHTGKLAARALVHAVKAGAGPAVLAGYEREADEKVRKNLSHALTMAGLVERFPRLAMRVFFDNREAMGKYVSIAAGRTDYRAFWKWLVPRIPFFLASSFFRTVFGAH